MCPVDASIIRRLKVGEEAAFRLIYERYSEQVYQLAFRFLKDTAWSEEIVQDVFLKLWLNREGLDERGNLWLYLYVIAKRLSLNKLREIRKSVHLFEQLIANMEALTNPTEEFLAAKEMEQHTEKIIAKLPKQQQLVFKLSREEGLSHNEIAQKLGLSSHTVKNHMVQALKTLRTSLQQTGHNPFIVLVLYWTLMR